MYLALLGLFIIFHMIMSILVWLLLDEISPILPLCVGNGVGNVLGKVPPFSAIQRGSNGD